MSSSQYTARYLGEAAKIASSIDQALELARRVGARIVGVVGGDGRYTAKVADAAAVIPTVSADTATPHTEALLKISSCCRVFSTGSPGCDRPDIV